MKVTITIERSKVMGIVEALSATIAQHNGKDFELMWASESELPRLDIWYRGAIGDLEQNLMRYVKGTSTKFDLSSSGIDYTLTLITSQRWGAKLQGLLGNKIQDYIVHAIIAGWLADFGELQAPDYTALSASDLSDINNIILYRQLAFDTNSRTSDSTKPQGEDVAPGIQARGTDISKPQGEAAAPTIRARGTDIDKPQGESAAPTIQERTSDSAKPQGEAAAPTIRARTSDSTKPQGEDVAPGTQARTSDSAKPQGEAAAPTVRARGTDIDKPQGEAAAPSAGVRSTDIDKPQGEDITPGTQARTSDSAKPQGESTAPIIQERSSDEAKPDNGTATESQNRSEDTVKAPDEKLVHQAHARTIENGKPQEDGATPTIKARGADETKSDGGITTETHGRAEDGEKHAGETLGTKTAERNNDDSCRMGCPDDKIDWSGSGLSELLGHCDAII